MYASGYMASLKQHTGGRGRDNGVEDVARSGLPKKRERHAGAAWQLVGAVQSQTPGARGYSDAAPPQCQEGCGP